MQLDAERWRADYRRRTEEIETVRSRETAALTDTAALEIIQSLRYFSPILPDASNGLGLVKQQAIFHRRRPPE